MRKTGDREHIGQFRAKLGTRPRLVLVVILRLLARLPAKEYRLQACS